MNYVHIGHNRFPFPTHRARNLDPVKALVDEAEIRIAIAGDSGTGAPAALAVRDQMKAKQPHHTFAPALYPREARSGIPRRAA